MNLMKSILLAVLFSVIVMACIVSSSFAADAKKVVPIDAPPKAPPASKFAPAEDLASQVEYYTKRLGGYVESQEEYKDSVDRIAKDSNTLIVIALTLGLHDTDNPYKSAAPEIIKASQELAKTKTYAEAKAAVAKVKKTTTVSKTAKLAPKDKKEKPNGLKWENVASLKQLMLAVPAINTQLKRNMKLRRPRRDGPKAAGRSAVIAVIGQASLYHSADTSKPKLFKEWYKYCEEMRNAAAEVNAIAHKGDKKAARKAMQRLAQSCDTCHEVFHKEAIGKEDAEE